MAKAPQSDLLRLAVFSLPIGVRNFRATVLGDTHETVGGNEGPGNDFEAQFGEDGSGQVSMHRLGGAYALQLDDGHSNRESSYRDALGRGWNWAASSDGSRADGYRHVLTYNGQALTQDLFDTNGDHANVKLTGQPGQDQIGLDRDHGEHYQAGGKDLAGQASLVDSSGARVFAAPSMEGSAVLQTASGPLEATRIAIQPTGGHQYSIRDARGNSYFESADGTGNILGTPDEWAGAGRHAFSRDSENNTTMIHTENNGESYGLGYFADGSLQGSGTNADGSFFELPALAGVPERPIWAMAIH